MFLARGLCYVISLDTITITNPFYTQVAQAKISLPGGSFVSINVIIALIILLLAIYLAHYTRFGRNVYALGGSEQSALLMGLRLHVPKSWCTRSAVCAPRLRCRLHLLYVIGLWITRHGS